MEYKQVISITGLGGLFQLISTKNDGAIVKSLTDDSVKFISARVHHITPLESIEIYTYEGNIRLHEVFEKIKENDEAVAKLKDQKDTGAAKAFFKSVLPNFDEERVYASDIRKILKWYAILKDKELLNFDALKQQEATPPPAETETKGVEAEPETATDDAAKGKKKAAKTTAAKSPAKKKPVKKEQPEETAAAKPAKKPATRKKKESEQAEK